MANERIGRTDWGDDTKFKSKGSGVPLSVRAMSDGFCCGASDWDDTAGILISGVEEDRCACARGDAAMVLECSDTLVPSTKLLKTHHPVARALVIEVVEPGSTWTRIC